MIHDILRKNPSKVSTIHWVARLPENAALLYRGGPEVYEDMADYVPHRFGLGATKL